MRLLLSRRSLLLVIILTLTAAALHVHSSSGAGDRAADRMEEFKRDLLNRMEKEMDNEWD